MQISEEEIQHIAGLSDLKIENSKINEYIKNLEDILSFAEIINNAPLDGVTETIGANDSFNVFRKDEVKIFEDKDSLLQNAPEQERGMFKIPKVIN